MIIFWDSVTMYNVNLALVCYLHIVGHSVDTSFLS